MCYFPYDKHDLTHWKFVLCCSNKCPSILIPGQESNKDMTSTCPEIRFHVCRNMSYCTMNVRRPYEEKTACSMFYTVTVTNTIAKLCTCK